MFNSAILDVAIGMVFVYLLLSLLCSAANEIIELWLKKRATDLERGIRELLTTNSASGTNGDLVHQLYEHALINGLFKGTYAASGIAASSRLARFWRYIKGTRLPAYIPSRNFALGLMDLILPGTAPVAPVAGGLAAAAPVASGASGATPVSFAVTLATPPPPPAGAAIAPGNPLQPLRAALGTNPLIAGNPNAQKALIALIDAAGNDVAKARENIEAWYNNSMDRVSGWYKRRSQVFILVIGLFVAIAVNADSVSIAKRLSTDKALRDSLVAAAQDYAKQNASPSPAPEKPATGSTNTKTDAGSSAPSGSVAGPSASVSPVPPSVAKESPSASATPSTTAAKASPASAVSPAPSPSVAASPSTPASPSAATAKGPASPEQAACAKDKDSAECKYEKSLSRIQSLGLPIGWDSKDDIQRQWPGWHWKHPGGWWDQIYWHWLGWLLTALAISLGAPFWFDMLNKLIVVRSTVKPREKSPDEPSKG